MPSPVSTLPRKSATQRRSRATVEAILDAAARILVRDGYACASTNRIAELAGVSIGSLYQYYPNKEAIVGALVARHNREMLALLREAMESIASLDLEGGLRTLIGAMIEAHRVDPVLHRIFDEQVPRMGQLAEIEAIGRDIFALVRAYLDSRCDEVGVTDLDTATFICVTTVETLTHEFVIRRPDSSAGEQAMFVEEVMRMVSGYLRAR